MIDLYSAPPLDVLDSPFLDNPLKLLILGFQVAHSEGDMKVCRWTESPGWWLPVVRKLNDNSSKLGNPELNILAIELVKFCGTGECSVNAFPEELKSKLLKIDLAGNTHGRTAA